MINIMQTVSYQSPDKKQAFWASSNFWFVLVFFCHLTRKVSR